MCLLAFHTCFVAPPYLTITFDPGLTINDAALILKILLVL